MKQHILSMIAALIATPLIAGPGYLGVDTEPLNEALAAQLGLDEGLVVTGIDDQSPANIMLKKHDILQAMDDTPLTGVDQLRELVRSQQADDEIKLQVIRKGKALEVSVVLGELPKARKPQPLKPQAKQDPKAPVDPFNFDIDIHADMDVAELMKRFQQGMQGFGVEMDDALKMMEGMQKQMEQQMKQFDFQFKGNPFGNFGGANPFDFKLRPQGPGGNFQGNSSSTITINENGLSVTLTTKNGDKHLKAVSPEGKELFDGPVNTDDEVSTLPPEVKRIYDNMKVGGGGFKFRKGPARPAKPRKGIVI